MPALLITLLAGLLIGVSAGWYLRRANAWCPRCGGDLACATCADRSPHRHTHCEHSLTEATQGGRA